MQRNISTESPDSGVGQDKDVKGRPKLKVQLQPGATLHQMAPGVELVFNDLDSDSSSWAASNCSSAANSLPLTPEVLNGGGQDIAQLNARLQRQLLLSTTPFEFGIQGPIPRSPCTPPEHISLSEVPLAPIKASDHARNTINEIRRIVDVMSVRPNPDKELIKLHLGDPTLTGSMVTHENVTNALVEATKSGLYNGYGNASGINQVREVLAAHIGNGVTMEDIILTSGCSHALQMAIEVLGNAGDNYLLPRPGFPLYSTLMRPLGIEPVYYNCNPKDGWKVDLTSLEQAITPSTKAIIINNPCNPTGAVYDLEHLRRIVAIAERHRVPIIADEIYGDMVYGGAQFHPIASLRPRVPVLTCDGISKRYLVPGWRLGWLIIRDVSGNAVLDQIRDGLRNLSQKIVGPCALVQGALPQILRETPEEFFQNTRDILCENAEIAMEVLSKAPGLRPVKPQGAMYMMVEVNKHRFRRAFKGKGEMAFIRELIAEESIYCLPGSAFRYDDAFRLVLTYPPDKTRIACQRIVDFCTRHYSKHESSPDKKIGPSIQILP